MTKQYAIELEGGFFLLDEVGADYATYSTEAEAENVALAYGDYDAQVVAL